MYFNICNLSTFFHCFRKSSTIMHKQHTNVTRFRIMSLYICKVNLHFLTPKVPHRTDILQLWIAYKFCKETGRLHRRFNYKMNLSDNHRQINRELEVSLKGMLYIIYLYIRYRVEDNLCRSHACRYLEDNRIWILLYHQLTKSFTILQGILRKNPRSCMICIWRSIFCILKYQVE